ncbi:MAG: response regulator [Microbacteriaceae bacterium]
MSIEITATTGRIAIVDDHELLLDGLATWVKANAPDLRVVTSVTGWFDLIRDPQFPPDVTIMDFELREPVSIETRIRTCLAAGSAVVVVSALESARLRDQVLRAGAAGFVPKSQPAGEVVTAVRHALSAKTTPTADPDEAVAADSYPFGVDALTTLRLYASGNSPVDIAVSRKLPFERVKKHLADVRTYYASGGRAAATRQQLIRRAVEDGYL